MRPRTAEVAAAFGGPLGTGLTMTTFRSLDMSYYELQLPSPEAVA